MLVADDTAIAGRILHQHGQQPQGLAAGLIDQRAQGIDPDERDITIEHQYLIGVLDMRQRLGHCVPRAQLFGLQYPVEVRTVQRLTHLLSTMTNDHMNTLGQQRACAIDHMLEHRLACHRVQHLGERRTHAGALAGGKNDYVQIHRSDPGRVEDAGMIEAGGRPSQVDLQPASLWFVVCRRSSTVSVI